jgi:hypothetical protein
VARSTASWFGSAPLLRPGLQITTDAARSLGQAWPKVTAQRREAGLRKAARGVTFKQVGRKSGLDQHGYSKTDFATLVAAVARRLGLELSDIEVWFGDEARVGQKNKITRRWARRGTRPSTPHDQRTASTYIFGAICPADGKAAGLVLPWCDTEAMNHHLAEISAQVAPGRHAVLLVDQAGWHLSERLIVPARSCGRI